ncbi:GNAT family N-acetyltransferase [Xinfangfangia sp. CPCC 101601]|uniref:GNAT family N-acetyltransferase n=1 Tax=Pseudogemmobacter lacusdianii TaxID=3069608 RepID=A0ABU0VYQ2_9RHOB|nr:GNAT family N-acetyltransferase [Xinfangfangia sp. CPCC 101601]MDQ2066871.1 GNAT family N-acetyltransferase [Xinfangfangia sp. CPCC 101601]
MSDPAAQITLLDSLTEISAAEWDAMAAPEQTSGRPEDPFTTHRFLLALETSGSTGKGTGWLPKPLILQQNGKPSAALPMFVKTHSQGEYIFDHSWADAYSRAGGQYYPKLQVAAPFTPVPGRRFLGPDAFRKPLASAAVALTEGNGLSSLHITFCTPEEARDLAGHETLLHRITHQYHWQNNGYASYEDFLSDLSSRKRKALRKERQSATSAGLTIRALTGDAIEPQHWDAFWAFYQDTGARKWGRPYLTRTAFDALHATMRQDMLLVLAFDGERPIAGALNFIGRSALYGRYWGAIEDHPALHFELCYHQAIDWAIAHGLQRVEAGAQGDHKLARGYLPVETHSLHYITDPGFRRAVADYLTQESRAVTEEIAALASYGPFRQS